MTKEQALQSFFNSYGLRAFEENSVPTGTNRPSYPYFTYEFQSDDFGNSCSISASLWYYSTTWETISNMANIIAIDLTGSKTICFDDTDGSQLWVRKGHPFVQNLPDAENDMIKRKIFNFEIEFFTIQ